MQQVHEVVPVLHLPTHPGHDGLPIVAEDASIPVAQVLGNAPPWVFGFTSMPYGMSAAFATLLCPYLLSKQGLSVNTIGWYTSIAMVPSFTQFLYTPIIDVWLRRKSWLVLLILLGGISIATSCFVLDTSLPEHLKRNIFFGLIFAGQVFAGLSGNCNGGLLATTLKEEQRGRAGGFYNAGNLGGGAVGAGVVLLLLGHIPMWAIGLVWFMIFTLPALAVLKIQEPEGHHREVSEVFGHMFREVWAMLRSKTGWSGLLFCLSPVGTVALMNTFTSLADDYAATPFMVAFVNGASSGILSALGSMLGGYVVDWWKPRYAYLLSGGMTVVVSGVMFFAPVTSLSYTIGVAVYFFIAGFAYSTFSAVVLESLGKAGRAASTQYSMFLAAGNLAITYVNFLNTRFYTKAAPSRVFGADAVLNALGVVILGIVLWLVIHRKQASHQNTTLR